MRGRVYVCLLSPRWPRGGGDFSRMTRAHAEGKGLSCCVHAAGHRQLSRAVAEGRPSQGKDLGYDIKIIESSRDQAEQDSRFSRKIATGRKVSGYIWWPYVNAAGTGSLRALSKTGVPVVFTNQYPIAGTDKFWTAYAGVNDFLKRRNRRQGIAQGMF